MNASKLKKWLKRIFWTVVVILVALVVSFFLPHLSAVPERARRRNCLSNLKQIGIALSMYAEQYQGRLPMDADNPTLVGSMRLMSNELTLCSVLVCPSDSRPEARWAGSWPRPGYEGLVTNSVSYSYVPNLMWHGPLSTNPPAIVMLDRIGSSTAAGSKWPKKGNHESAGGNVLFTDGHVEWATQLPSALKDKNGKETVLSP